MTCVTLLKASYIIRRIKICVSILESLSANAVCVCIVPTEHAGLHRHSLQWWIVHQGVIFQQGCDMLPQEATDETTWAQC